MPSPSLCTLQDCDSDLGGSGTTASVAAFTATWLTSLIEGPADHFKQMVQVAHTNGGAPVSTFALVSSLFRQHGLKGIYFGYLPFLVGQVSSHWGMHGGSRART